MEINKFKEIIGVVTQEEIVEGRMVILTANNAGTVDYGSRAELMGVRLPVNDTEAQKAKYCVTWPVNNANAEGPIKLMVPTPSLEWSLRQGGWDQAANVPFTTKVYLTYPGNQESVAIPSGWLALAYAGGVFTVPSGNFVYSANLVPGAPLEVLNKTDDTAAQAGKLSYASAGVIAVVERFDATKYALTFRTLY